MKPVRWLAPLACCLVVFAQEEVDSEESRKVLGSSVVTSVSVIMDHGNGTKTYITDAAGQPVDQTEGAVGSPVDLLNPDRYEFYTFDETGDLVKRLMTLDQIKGLLAGGDGETLDNPSNSPTFYHDTLSSSHIDDSDLEPNMAQGVHSVVANVQNVLRSELEASKTKVVTKPPLSIPDSISSWSMLFPAIIGDSSEALDDGSDTGNSVNEPIVGGDRLPASSNIEKTEVKVSPEDTTQEKNDSATEKPTAVPPIIHFLEIQSVPSPMKGPTKTPTNLASTAAAITSTTETPITTGEPTSPENSIQEMSASISDVLSQVTDNQTSDNILKSAEESKINESSVSSPTTETINKEESTSGTKSTEKVAIKIKPILKPESSIVNSVTTSPQEGVSKESSVTESRLDNPTESPSALRSTTEGNVKQNLVSQTTLKSNTDSITVTKKTTDAVVSLLTTPKPNITKVTTSENTKNKPLNAAASSVVKQKVQPTTPGPSTSVKKNNNKIQPSTSAIPTTTGKVPPKKSNKPAAINKISQNSETLEAHGSEEIVKVVPNKQSSTASIKTKVTQTKPNVSSITSTSKPLTKPNKKVSTKPNITEELHDCGNHKPSSAGEIKNSEKLQVAASTNVNERIQPSKLKTPVFQEIKTVQKPTSQNNKVTANKIKPSEDIKITTYKPSTSQPFTTKHSIHKISTTTERPSSEHKITSASKIHEVNSSLLDIKNQALSVPGNKSEIPSSSKLTAFNSTKNQNKVPSYESAASSNDETKIPVQLKTPPNVSLHKHEHHDHNSTDNVNHKGEVECTHSKKPVHASIQDKISDSGEDFAASNSDEIKVTTTTTVPVPDVTTDVYLKDLTTEDSPKMTTIRSPDEAPTTTEQSEEVATELPETTTLNMPEMDFVKEGISAVTNILLDTKPPLEPQLPMPTLPLSESASNIVNSPPVKGELKHAASFDDFEMTTTDLPEESSTVSSSSTTEKELIVFFTTTNSPDTDPTPKTSSSLPEKEPVIYFTTTDIAETETVPPTTENIISSNDTIESSEGITEQIPDSETTPSVNVSTVNNKEVEIKESSESKIISTISNQTLPTKESKLSPENLNETLDLIIPCNHTQSQNNLTNVKSEQLEPAQSIISEVNKTSSETTSISSTIPPTPEETTLKNKDESFNLDFKTALRPEPSKIDRPFTQVKYPSLQNAYRPLQDPPVNPPTAVELHPAPHESMGLEATTAFLADDVRRFSDLCNELAFRMWTSITGKGSISSRSLVLSPFATTSLLAMVFLGARGPTSGQMNDVLRLDDMVTFNPHQVLQNVTESVLNSRNYGVTTAAFVRELYSDKLKGKILDFYKERAQQYYDGHVEEISFNTIGDILRRRTNLLVKRQTLGKVPEYLRGSNLNLRPPLAAFSANIFQTDCDLASTEGRDGEMYFVVRPSTRQRRLVPVPAAVWRTGFLAGYEPGLDATAVALGTDSVASTILVLPGQQGQVAPGDGLARLEQRLIETSYRRGGWTRLLRSLLPRPGLELQVPRFSHRSVLNITSTLQRMGLKDLFNENKADLRGLNGLSNDLHLSDIVQVNTFSTCGEDTIGARHHIETYPVSPQRMGRDDPELYPRPEDLEDHELLKIPLNLRPRQARLPDNPRLRFDRPFLYMVRHNPTGMILHMGRFNPRLLP